jgi:hypothetical protein
MTEIELLKRKLADAEAEVVLLRLRVSNLMLLLRKEMTSSGSLPESKEKG